MTLLLIFIAQVLFNIFKVLEIRYTLQHNVTRLLFNSVWINLVALASTFYSIDGLLKGNFFIILFYISGSVVGKYIGMKIEITKSTKKRKGFNILEYF
jgi:NADH:ubiquinone oxidoreductase subunit K